MADYRVDQRLKSGEINLTSNYDQILASAPAPSDILGHLNNNDRRDELPSFLFEQLRVLRETIRAAECPSVAEELASIMAMVEP